MNGKKRWVIVSVALCFVLGSFCIALTAEEQAVPEQVPQGTEAVPPSDLGETVSLSVSGEVGMLSAAELILKEYDAKTGETVDVSYTLDPQVSVVNADALEAITPGTKLDVSYVVEGDKKIAKVLTVVAEQPVKLPAE